MEYDASRHHFSPSRRLLGKGKPPSRSCATSASACENARWAELPSADEGPPSGSLIRLVQKIDLPKVFFQCIEEEPGEQGFFIGLRGGGCLYFSI